MHVYVWVCVRASNIKSVVRWFKWHRRSAQPQLTPYLFASVVLHECEKPERKKRLKWHRTMTEQLRYFITHLCIMYYCEINHLLSFRIHDFSKWVILWTPCQFEYVSICKLTCSLHKLHRCPMSVILDFILILFKIYFRTQIFRQ